MEKMQNDYKVQCLDGIGINSSTLESCLMVSTKVEYIHTLYSSNFALGYVLNIKMYVGLLMYLSENVQSCFTNNQNQEAS